LVLQASCQLQKASADLQGKKQKTKEQQKRRENTFLQLGSLLGAHPWTQKHAGAHKETQTGKVKHLPKQKA